MLSIKKIAVAVLFLAAVTVCSRADINAQVRLDFFYSPGCTECEQVKKEVLPQLSKRFRDSYELFMHDMTEAETIPLLIAYQDRCGNTDNGRVSLVVDHTVFISGYEAAATGLVDQVSAALQRRGEPGWKFPRSPFDTDDEDAKVEIVRQRAGGMTFSVVAIGGLLDGLN
ncbi:MAG: hypothetical protein PHU80_06155, partial [Kiritimatiellae bacterium]|nr:hypothetical protein [Kiritimatiellia bacterium]